MPITLSPVFLKKQITGRILSIIVPFFFLVIQANAQERLNTPIKLKVEDGTIEEVSVVVHNKTTGESHTVPGVAKFDLELKINCDYVISFSKPGYITKKIGLNTTAPADRVAQGFYPFNYEVILFKQYDGVNIVIFNQPVGKISYNRLIDDFDYDTDYTKQIQSALKAAEAEIKEKQKEARAKEEQLLKEEAKKKAEEAAQAKAATKANLEAEKKAAEEAKLLDIQAAKEKKALEEQQKKDAKAIVEAEKQRAMAILEEEERAKASAAEAEEERAKASAAEAEEERKKTTAGTGNDIPPDNKPKGAGEEVRPGGRPGIGTETPVTASNTGSGEEILNTRPAKGSGADELDGTKADAKKRSEKGFVNAVSNQGQDSRPEAASAPYKSSAHVKTPEPVFEVLPEITVEEINETNRVIIRVTVRKNQKDTIFSKVKYTWGGVFYFRQNMSISENLYFINTGMR